MCDVGKSEDPTFLVLFPIVVLLSENVKELLNEGSCLGFTYALKHRNLVGDEGEYSPDEIWKMLQLKAEIVYQIEIS